MADTKRPRRREKNITGKGKDVQTHGSGMGNSSPVGSGSRPENTNTSASSSSQGKKGSYQIGGGYNQNAGSGSYFNNNSNYNQGSGSNQSFNQNQSFGQNQNSNYNQNPNSGLGGLLSGAGSGLSSQKPSVKKSLGGIPTLLIIAVVVFFIIRIIGNNSGGGSSAGTDNTTHYTLDNSTTTQNSTSQSTTKPDSNSGYTGSYTGSSAHTSYQGNAAVSSGWSASSNATTTLNTTVASGVRDKYTKILGNGKDTVTLMIYMCGTDLESRSGMATADLSEIAQATYGDNVKVIIYTGGCKSWRNNVISSSVNQIYQIANGKFLRLVEDAGTSPMTDPDTLSSFIQFCSERFPANRNMLIFWDHGGGSVTGYGYDEKNPRDGSMDLSEIQTALKAGKVQFDWIGFDACLMATLENGLMLNNYADYMIASEETEPGTGWYYTNWLTQLGSNTSLSTPELGKMIADDFISANNAACRGQKMTLSVVDLAELSANVPSKLKAFSQSISSMISNKQYQTVSDARYQTREFGTSSQIDQVDLVHLAQNMGNKEGQQLAEALLGSVKYNRTSSNITNAYGLAIFFPYQRASYVDTAVSTYEQIGMDSSYSECIRAFASLEVSGQVAAGGSYASSPLFSLLGGMTQGSSGDVDMISSLLSGFLGGSSSGSQSPISGLSGLESFLTGRALSMEDTAGYLADNYFDPSQLYWNYDNGQFVMYLDDAQWQLVHMLDLNVFYDDGKGGYLDLGLDNIYDFDDQGNLIADTEGTWIAINEQPVAYYHMDTVDDGENYTISGYVPALLNGERVNLILVFDNDNPYGCIAGVMPVYGEGSALTVAKNSVSLEEGDELQFLCDRYTADGSFDDTYLLGDPIIVDNSLMISDVYLEESNMNLTYVFTDIYNQRYWSQAITYKAD